MSLNSLQDDMSRRAASMAAMAKRARNPQEIQAIQRSLINGVQSGAIQPHIGIPLIQDLTKKITEVKAQMAQGMAGAGMQLPQGQQGAPQQPIAQQIMAQAAQESQGVEALPSNLPESYAGGGIIAFEGGGRVERFQNTGSTGTTPAGRFFSGLGQSFSEDQEAAKLRNRLQMKYGPASALPGLFMRQSDEERQMAKEVAKALPNMSMEQLLALEANGPSVLASFASPTQAVTPLPTPAVQAQPKVLPPTPPAASAAPGVGFKMPNLQTFTPTPAVLPERTMPQLTDLNAIVSGMPAKTKKATEDAVKETQTKLEEMDKPGFEAREGRLGKREATQEKDSAIGRALNLMNLGLGIAGSKERTLAGALGNEGRQGIRDLIQGEAANRAARDRLEEYRDNLEQQKIAAKKGNYQAAQTAGREASRDLQAATSLSLQGAQAGNAQATSLYSILQQGDIGKATLANQGQQLQLSAVDSANRNVLGLAQLQQQNAATNAQLTLGRERIQLLKSQVDAGNERAKAILAQAEIKASTAWQSSPDYRTAQEKAKKMPPIEAQRFMQQSWLQYKDNMLPSLMGGQGGGANIPSFSDLYKATE